MIKELKVADSELIHKFKVNCSKILPSGKVDKAIQLIFDLEKLDDTSKLMETLSI